nr:ribonuclease H-like domain-containing protein [Tanacetum cinerariifolium]
MILKDNAHITAQRVANAIETIAIYETKTRMAREATNQNKHHEGKIVEDTNNKRNCSDGESGLDLLRDEGGNSDESSGYRQSIHVDPTKIESIKEWTSPKTATEIRQFIVIEFGDSYKAPPEETDKGPASESSAKKKGTTVVITTEDMQKRRNDVKTFGGNEATKKTKKNQLKQQYGNFKAKGLAPEWLMYTIVWRNKDDLDNMSLDDVYNHLKVYEPEVQKKSESNSQNMAFISSSNTSSGKECRAPRSQDRGKRESYKQGPKKEEPAPTALMAIDGIGWDWSYLANEEENHALIAEDEVLTEFALMDKSRSSLENEVYDDSYCSKSCRKNTENLYTKISKLNEELSDCETDLYHYKRCLSQVEARLVEFKEQEIKFCEKIKGLERDVEVRNNKIEYLMNELEQVKKEKEGLDNKLTGFESALKDLDNLLGSQKSDKNKEGIGYNAAPPPTQVYSPPKKDLSWISLPEFVDDTVTDYSRPTPSIDASKSDCPRVIKTNNTKNARKSTVKYAEMYRNTSKILKVRGNQRNWNNLKSQQLGKDFLMQNKACFKCGYFDHLASDYDVWVEKGKTWPKNTFARKRMTPKVVLLKPGYWDNGYSRHMNRNLSYLSEYEPYDGGYVSFGQGGGKSTGKQHKASCKTKLVNSVSKPLHTLHMDLFGPTSVSSLNHKWDEGYFVEYFMSSKAFRVFNKRTKKVEENLHVDFFENKLIEKGAGPNWLFDIDTLTNSMNYVPVVVAGTSFTNILGIVMHQMAIMLMILKAVGSNPTATSKVPSAEQVEPVVSLTVETKIPTVSSHVPTVCLDISPESLSDPRFISKRNFSQKETPFLDNALTLSNRFEDTFGMEADLSNMETSIPASPTLTFRIHKDHPKSQIIGPVDAHVQTRHKSKEMEEQSFVATIHQKTNPDLL